MALWVSPTDGPDAVISLLSPQKKLLVLLQIKFRLPRHPSHTLNHRTDLDPGGPNGKQMKLPKTVQTLKTEFHLNP